MRKREWARRALASAGVVAGVAWLAGGAVMATADDTDAGATGQTGSTGSLSERARQAGICDVVDTTTVNRAYPSQTPEYFMKPMPNSNRVAYISGSGNRILDLSNGHELPAPGYVDPVPTPDERFITTPMGGLAFAATSDVVTGNTTPLYTDPDRSGVYQSTSIVSGTGTGSGGSSSTTYRVLTDQGGTPTIRDYVATRDASGHDQIAPKGPIVTLCPGLQLSLPMISKDGKQIGAYDVQAQVTKIWDIDPQTGACHESLNLGFPTGKVEFNYNDDEIAFHAFNNTDYDGHYILQPSDEYVGNVYVLKRSTHELIRVTNNTQSNAIYPGWRRDGLITYIDHPTHAGIDGTPRSSAVVADWRHGRKTLWDIFDSDCLDLNSALAYNKVVALGALWTQLCSQYGGAATANTDALNTLSINPVRCRQMVHDYWGQLKGQIAGSARLTSANNSRVKTQVIELLSENDLLAACPDGGGPITPVVHASPVPPPAPAPVVSHGPVPQSCVACHMPRIDFNNLASLRQAHTRHGAPLIPEILRRLNLPSDDPQHMPQGEDLTPAEKQAFVDYLMR